MLLVAASFYFSFTNPVAFFVTYSLAALGDIADGHAARAFDQCMEEKYYETHYLTRVYRL